MSDAEDKDRTCLRAVMDCIFPADRDPGATDLNADSYVERQLMTDRAGDAAAIRAGLAALEAAAVASCGAAFAALHANAQLRLIAAIEGEAWFALLAELTAEGVYADPANGGNRDAASWAMIGYAHRLPGGPSGGGL